MAEGFHILVVEDDPLVAEDLQTTLESQYRVSCAKTVGEARAFRRTSHLDAVLVDRILPDGRSDEIIEIAEGTGTPVVSMSGYPAEMAGHGQSAQCYLMKPFQMPPALRYAVIPVARNE
jgi:DNA-binding response OmpR family regulator